MYEYVAIKKNSKNKQRKDENERNYYKKSRGEQEKIVSRKSDENKRKLFPENPMRTGENKRKLF